MYHILNHDKRMINELISRCIDVFIGKYDANQIQIPVVENSKE